MGFNTTVVVMNDALHIIKDDPKFGKNLYHAVMELQLGKGAIDIPAYTYVDGEARGAFCNAATAIESHHADITSIVAVGGNCGAMLGHAMTHIDNKLEILKQLAESMGYTLRKKPSHASRNSTSRGNEG